MALAIQIRRPQFPQQFDYFEVWNPFLVFSLPDIFDVFPFILLLLKIGNS